MMDKPFPSVTYEVCAPRTYLRRCSWGDPWRVLMPLGYRVSCERSAFASEPIMLRIWDGAGWQEQTWWRPGTLGDLP